MVGIKYIRHELDICMPDKLYCKYYKELQASGKYRQLSNIDSQLLTNNLDFSTNDYLALSKHPDLLVAAYKAAKQYGVGATGSRLLSGNKKIFAELESRISLDKGTESALIFNSGFQANITVLSSLLDSKVLGKTPLVFFDKLNHASLYQAVFLSKAELIRYRHNDMQHLSSLLCKFSSVDQPKFIVTETVFGMDGDLLLIDDLLNLAKTYGAFVYLDEAHATGVVGCSGYGLAAKLDFHNVPHLIMGTFSKALGCSGGYIATSINIKNYLINKAAGFIYSTALSPMVVGAACKAWSMVQTMNKQRKKLFLNSSKLRKNLKSLGFDIGLSQSHIIPVIVSQEHLAIKIKEYLFKQGIIVSCVRPPTVPIGSARLRLALNVHHTNQDIQQLIDVFKTL